MKKSDLIQKSPYFDKYDSSKNYSHLLAVPGRVAQAREFTELQSTIYDNLSRVADTLFKDGDIISGCNPAVIPSEDSQYPYIVRIEPGFIYINGLIRSVESQDVLIKGTGAETIYVSLKEEVITAATDPDLKDPAVGNENANMIGMDRLKYSVVFSTSKSDSSYSIYKFNDGQLYIEPLPDKYAEIKEILAKRTYNESGNYKVEGLVLTEMAEELRDSGADGKITTNLSEGLAYILGYEVYKPTTTYPEFNKALTFRSMMNESERVVSGVYTYQFMYSPIFRLKEVRAEFKRTHYEMSRGSSIADVIRPPYDSVTEVLQVYRGGTVYTPNVDYILDNGAIRWLSSNAPANQEQYFVDFQYLRIINVDDSDVIFDMTKENNISKYCSISTVDGSSYFTYNFTGSMETSAGMKTVAEIAEDSSITVYDDLRFPVVGSYMRFEYDYYLGRLDILSLDKDGNIVILEGIPSTEADLSYPSFIPDHLLALALVYVYPDSNRVKVTNLSTERLSMQDLAALYGRVKNLEYNIAVSDLDREAIDYGAASDLIGVYTDGFIGLSKSDVEYEDPSNPGVSAYSVEMNQQEGYVKIADKITLSDLTNFSNSNIYDNGETLSLKRLNSVELISQKKRTGVMNINPYMAYAKFCPITLVPNEDYWVSNEIIVNGNIGNVSALAKTVIDVNGDPSLSSVQDQYLTAAENGSATSTSSWSSSSRGTTTSFTKRTTQTASTTDVYSTFMRSRKVEIHAQGFVPNAPSISAKLGAVELQLTPVDGSGTLPGLGKTVQADANGKVDAYFLVPENKILSGSAEFVLQAANEGDGSGSAVYTSKGLSRTVTYTATESITSRTTNLDPLAQTFVLNEATTLTGLDLFFATKDKSYPLIVRITGTDNGYPSSEIYYETIINADQINVPATETDDMVATHIDFMGDIILSPGSYAIAVLTDVSSYKAFTATLGENIYNSEDEFISSQPYLNGILFSSSNALAWTAHQDSDLTFVLYGSQYYTGNNESWDGEVIEFQRISLTQFHAFMLATSSVIPDGTSISWYYSIDGTTYNQFEPNNIININTTSYNLWLRAKLFTSNNTVTPLIKHAASSVLLFKENGYGSYISRGLDLDQSEQFNSLDVYITIPKGQSADAIIPRVAVSKDTSGNDIWQELTLAEDGVTDVSYWFSQLKFSKKFSSYVGYYRIRLDMRNSGTSPKAYKLMSIFTEEI